MEKIIIISILLINLVSNATAFTLYFKLSVSGLKDYDSRFPKKYWGADPYVKIYVNGLEQKHIFSGYGLNNANWDFEPLFKLEGIKPKDIIGFEVLEHNGPYDEGVHGYAEAYAKDIFTMTNHNLRLDAFGQFGNMGAGILNVKTKVVVAKGHNPCDGPSPIPG